MKRVTIRDIAERCGVSPTVVSAVLNRPDVRPRCSSEKCELIRKTAQELHYQLNILARSMVLQHVPVVALLLHSGSVSMTYANDYFSERSSMFVYAMEKYQIEVLLVFYHDETEQLKRFESLHSKGLIGGVASNLIPGSHHEFPAALRNSGMPYVQFGDAGEHFLAIRMNSYYPFTEEYHKRFGTNRCFLMQELNGVPVLYPYKNRPEYNRFDHEPIPVSDTITADPENLILILGAEYYLRSRRKFAHPLIVHRIQYKYLLPPGVSYALYDVYEGQCENLAAKLLAEWMRGNPPVEQEYCLPCNDPVELFFAPRNAR